MALGMFTGRGDEYDPRLDIRPAFSSRSAGSAPWAAQGVSTLLGTGVRGSHIWDGRPHWEAIQASKHLDISWDASGLAFARVPVGPYCTVTAPHMALAFYMCPTHEYTDARIHEILAHLQPHHVGIELDEPEFWSRGGYGQGFKDEWQAFYGESWQDPDSSVEARYKASQLMAHLLVRFVREVFRAVRARNPSAFCMVNPHSPFSYAEAFTTRSVFGDIISTIGELADVAETDALLAEVWSDTVKAPLVHRGAPTIEPFLHSWVDRSLFENLGRGCGKRVFQLLDPKSDDPKFPWASYRHWFEEDTLAALMVGGQDFWVSWTDRIMLMEQPPAGPAPAEYRTVFCTVMNVCRDAERFPHRPWSGIGVPVSDTIMWQRDAPGRNYIDAFYALTLPLLDQGIPVDVLPMECAPRQGFLDDSRVLLTSFEFWNPQRVEMVEALADWARRGGTLVYYGASEFDAVPTSWWCREGYVSSRAALFARLGLGASAPQAIPLQVLTTHGDLHRGLGGRVLAEPLPSPAGWWQVGSLLSEGFLVQPHLWALPQPGSNVLLTTVDGLAVAWEVQVGRGHVIWVGLSPWFMAWGMEGPLFLHATTELACERAGIPYAPGATLDVRRGPFRFAYAFREHEVEGAYLNLLDHRLRVENSPRLGPRQYRMLYDLGTVQDACGLVYSGGLARGVRVGEADLSLSLEGPEGCTLATALRVPSEPATISVRDERDGKDLLAWSAYDAPTGLLRLGHRSPAGSARLQVAW